MQVNRSSVNQEIERRRPVLSDRTEVKQEQGENRIEAQDDEPHIDFQHLRSGLVDNIA